MKLIKIVITILLFCVLVFFLLGLIVPEIPIETKVTIDRPTAVAYRVFMDEEKTKDWVTGFKEKRTIKETVDGINSEYELIFHENGEDVFFQEEVMEIVKNEKLKIKLDHEVMTVKSTIDFVEHTEGTEIVSTSVFKGKNWFWRSVMPLMKGEFEMREKQNYENLKKLVEKLYPIAPAGS